MRGSALHRSVTRGPSPLPRPASPAALKSLLVIGAAALALVFLPGPAFAVPGEWQEHVVSGSTRSFRALVDDGHVVYSREAASSGSLWLFDCADGRSTQLAARGFAEWVYDLDDGRVVWTAPGDGGTTQIVIRDLVSGQITRLSREEQVSDLDVDGSLLAWLEGPGMADTTIYVYDIVGGRTLQLTADDDPRDPPAVGDGLVVWSERASGGRSDVFVFQAGSGVVRQLTTSADVGDYAPRTSSGWVVWRASRINTDLLMWDSRSDRISIVTGTPWDEDYFALEGDRLYYLSEWADEAFDVYRYRLDEHRNERITENAHAFAPLTVDLGMGAWRDSTGGMVIDAVYFHDSTRDRVRRAGSPLYSGWAPQMDGGVLVWDAGPALSSEVHMLTREALPDVPWWHLHGSAIGELAERRVIEGYGDGTFRPAEPVRRQHFAKMVTLALYYPVSEADMCPFADVEISGPGTLYPDNYIAVAAARGLTRGTGGGLFSPYAEISRAQVITMMVRAAGSEGPGRLAQPPVGYRGSWGDFSTTHADNARLAEYNHLLDGMRLRGVDPWGSMTRGECAQILCNLIYYLEIFPYEMAG